MLLEQWASSEQRDPDNVARAHGYQPADDWDEPTTVREGQRRTKAAERHRGVTTASVRRVPREQADVSRRPVVECADPHGLAVALSLARLRYPREEWLGFIDQLPGLQQHDHDGDQIVAGGWTFTRSETG